MLYASQIDAATAKQMAAYAADHGGAERVHCLASAAAQLRKALAGAPVLTAHSGANAAPSGGPAVSLETLIA